MWSSFTMALSQMGDARFMKVTALGVALTIALLVGVYAATLWLLEWFAPDTITIPFVGPIGGIDTLIGIGSILLMIGLSVFLMVPVASAFSGLFLDTIAQAVEDRHYPTLPPAKALPLTDTLISSLNFFGLVVFLNLLALIGYIFAGPFAPIVFWAVNGYLLGREYFSLAAERRMPKAEARALRRANSGTIWLAGTLMAAPLSIPLVNLLIPVLGAATFTHLFHRVMRQS
ncbi:MAG: EI24 domain-containing protein [Paracoccaceae bacterium]